MPDWAQEVQARLSSLQLTPTREREIVDELSQHLEDRYSELVACGASHEDATRLTLNEFHSGNRLARHLSALRQSHSPTAIALGEPTGSVLTDLWLDVRYAVRGFLKEPGFSSVVVATLAVCLAANIATFAVVDGVVLRPLPFPEAQRLVAIYNSYPGAGRVIGASSAADFYERQRLSALAGLASYHQMSLSVGGQGTETERVDALITTPSLFELIGARPLRGRLLLEADAQPGAEQKVLLTYGYWQRVFAGRDAAIGQTLRVNGALFSVVGVLPEGWRFIDPDLQVVIPAAYRAEERQPAWRHRNVNWRQVARLAPGATLESLQSQIDALNAANLEETPELREPLANMGFITRAVPFQRFVVGQAAQTLYLIWGGVTVVLLVGGLNLANMMLVRAAGRRREWATRLALGASRGRLLRQSLIESWLLTVGGAALGLLLAFWALALAPSLGLDQLPRGTEIAVEIRALAFLSAIALLVGTVLGLLPLVAHGPTLVAHFMREEGRSETASRATRRFRRMLASAQIACALTLLLAGGALLASLQRVLAVDVGFRPERLLTAQVNLSQTRYTTAVDVRNLLDRLLTQVRRLPGAEAAGLASATPFGGAPNQNMILAEGYQMAPDESLVSAQHVSVSDGYFEAIGARLVAGRWFDHSDMAGGRRVIVIDEKLARKFFPAGDAIGRRMWELRGSERIFQQPPDDRMLTVVGVVAEVRLSDVVDDPGVRSNGACYYPSSQRTPWAVGLAIRTAGEPTSLVSALRRVLVELDPELPMFDVAAVDHLIHRSLVDRRAPALLAAAFALVALLLAALGVYGVLSYQVSQRTREIGVRMALGADARRIFRLVLSDGAIMIGAGTAIGLMGATLLRRTIETQLYGTKALEPAVLVLVSGLLAVVALLATAIPARRAARTDPNTALSHV